MGHPKRQQQQQQQQQQDFVSDVEVPRPWPVTEQPAQKPEFPMSVPQCPYREGWTVSPGVTNLASTDGYVSIVYVCGDKTTARLDR